MAEDATTQDLRSTLYEALVHWKAARQDEAIEAVREHADLGSLPAAIALAWFYAQRGQGAQAEQAVRTALSGGIVYPGLWHFRSYASVQEYVPFALEIARAAADGGNISDQVGYWETLWDAGFQDAAVSLFEAAGSPHATGMRGEWERLVADARSGEKEIQAAAAIVGSSRAQAESSIQQSEELITAERERVRNLVQETADLVHRVTAGHIGTAYAERAKDTLRAARNWTVAAVVVGFVASAWAAYVAYHAFSEDEGLSTTVGKTLVSVPLFVVAGYLASVGASNRKMGWHWTHIELQIRTAEPFIGVLDEPTRHKLLAALALRFFPGQGQDPQSGGGSESYDPGAVIASVLGPATLTGQAARARPSSTSQAPPVSSTGASTEDTVQ